VDKEPGACVSKASAVHAASLIVALSDWTMSETPISILAVVIDGPMHVPPLPEHADLAGVCVGYIQEKSGLSQSTISTYMSALRSAGLVVSERHGQWTFYRRNEAAIVATLDELSGELL